MGDSERTSQALGAGDSITVGEKTYRLHPVVAGSLADLERDALKYYKRQYLETYTDNLDLLPGNEHAKQDLMLQKLEDVAKWDLEDLPSRSVYSTVGIPIDEEMRKWIKDNFQVSPELEMSCQVVLAMALDNKRITPQKVYEMTGKYPREAKVRYDQWWVTATRTGMISFVLSSLRLDDRTVTDKDVADWSIAKLIEASRLVEKVTVASVGNG